MLKNAVRKILLTVCLTVCAFATAAGILISPSTRVSAETTTWKTAKFAMEDGVSLKLGAEKNGLRFIVSMDETMYNFLKANEDAELGIIISTQWYMESTGGDYLNAEKKIGGALSKNKLYKDGDSYCANACITNVQYKNFEYDFTAVAYVEYNGEIRYTQYNTLARNNLYDTVNMAVLNGYADAVLDSEVYTKNQESGDGWYGTEEFPILVENTSEYDKVVELFHKVGCFIVACENILNLVDDVLKYGCDITRKPCHFFEQRWRAVVVFDVVEEAYYLAEKP